MILNFGDLYYYAAILWVQEARGVHNILFSTDKVPRNFYNFQKSKKKKRHRYKRSNKSSHYQAHFEVKNANDNFLNYSTEGLFIKVK